MKKSVILIFLTVTFLVSLFDYSFAQAVCRPKKALRFVDEVTREKCCGSGGRGVGVRVFRFCQDETVTGRRLSNGKCEVIRGRGRKCKPSECYGRSSCDYCRIGPQDELKSCNSGQNQDQRSFGAPVSGSSNMSDFNSFNNLNRSGASFSTPASFPLKNIYFSETSNSSFR